MNDENKIVADGYIIFDRIMKLGMCPLFNSLKHNRCDTHFNYQKLHTEPQPPNGTPGELFNWEFIMHGEANSSLLSNYTDVCLDYIYI